jgi:4-hydroxybenzoate polyprenyltransferase
MGAFFALGRLDVASVLGLVALVIGNTCLLAHVFVLNDWAGIEGDDKDPHRATRTFRAKGASRNEILALSLTLLACSLALFCFLGVASLGFAVLIVALSAAYSAPGLHAKGAPLVNSGLHLAGGTAHFLLGYVAFAPFAWNGFAIGCYFGLVFAAGHLTHEARDYRGDLMNGIRTNAVAFGQKPTLLASLALFSAAYALLVGLALTDVVPMVMASVALIFPLHLLAVWQALRSPLGYEDLRLLQARYRLIHAAIGLLMAGSILPWQAATAMIR